MTQLEALNALIGAVEVGVLRRDLDFALIAAFTGFTTKQSKSFIRAINKGSMDAAIAFKKAVVPEWAWGMSDNGDVTLWLRNENRRQTIHTYVLRKPAAALVLASLKAKVMELEG